MELFAGLSVGLLILVSLFIAIKTFALWRRTKGLPEFLLGGMLLSATVLGYPFMIASTLIPPTELWGIHLGAQLLMSVGFGCLLLFTLKVFRPDTLWARCLAGFLLVLMAVGCLAYFFELQGENPRRPGDMVGLTMLNTIPTAAVYFWTTIESLSYYRRLRLRLRLGLADVVVTNRFLLWGLMTLAAGIAVLINLGGLLVGAFMSPPIVAVSSALGLVLASCLFLAFHPPGWYTDWVSQETAAEVG